MIEKKIALLNQTTLESLNQNDRLVILKQFMKTGQKILKADFSFAWWKVDEKYFLAYKSPTTPYNPNYPRKRGGNYVAQKTKRPLYVTNVGVKPKVIKKHVGPHMRAYVIIPIFFKKSNYGNMVFCFKKRNPFPPEQRTLCVALGNAAAQAITIHHLMEGQQTARVLAEHLEKRFRSLIENSHDAILLIDPAGKIKYASPSAQKISGYDPEELIGRNQAEFIHQEDLPTMALKMQEILQNPENSNIMQFRYKHKDRSWRWLESTGKNMLDNPSIGSIVANVRDITERKKFEEQLKALSIQKDEFFSVASHELKTPVTTIKGFSQLLLMRLKKNDPELKSFASKINLQADKLNHLINDLLDVSRISTGKFNYHYCRFELSRILETVVQDLRMAIGSHPIGFKSVGQFWVEADQERIGQVLTNLLNNAAKYSPPGSDILVKISQDKGQAQISVEDFGIGIPKKIRRKIFERFFQAKNFSTEVFSGMGLGLYISSTIIKEHKGQIALTDKKTKGSIFSFTLPYFKCIINNKQKK